MGRSINILRSSPIPRDLIIDATITVITGPGLYSKIITGIITGMNTGVIFEMIINVISPGIVTIEQIAGKLLLYRKDIMELSV
jgi:hypothetical protein